MPRDGSGRAHNEVEGGEIVHGAGDKDVGVSVPWNPVVFGLGLFPNIVY